MRDFLLSVMAAGTAILGALLVAFVLFKALAPPFPQQF